MRLSRFLLVTSVFLGLTVLSYTLHSSAKGQSVAPELEPNLGWLNTDRPLRFDADLKGHVVLLDFWTFCCINCMHVLPDLEYLEEKYADEPFIVIGVHSAKFDNEASREGIRNAIFRYDIHHPVAIDDKFSIWRRYGARGWPTFVLIGSDGNVIGQASGEGLRETLDVYIAEAIEKGRADGSLADQRVEITHDGHIQPATDLRYPGKVMADRAGGRMFIADSSNDRVIVAAYPDADGQARVQTVYGGGGRGLVDGPAGDSRFHDPQGMALSADRATLYVADTNNHAIRAIDLDAGTVTTIAGDGEQSRDREGGGVGTEQGLNSPWALALAADGVTLYIAMAGPHQLWRMNVEDGVVARFAGSGRENIVDGGLDDSQLAQPSGLAFSSDGSRLYFADSEVSAVRYVDLNEGLVKTVIGAGLFEFGDIDGTYPEARLQHCLGVALLPTSDGDRVLVADTYNHKIRIVDPEEKRVTGWAGAGRGIAQSESELRLDEPGGLFLTFDEDGSPADLFVADTNNHRIVVIDPNDRSWREVMLSGLDESVSGDVPENAITTVAAVRPGDPFSLTLNAKLPAGAHPTPEAPVTVQVTHIPSRGQRMLPQRIVQQTLRTESFPVSVTVPGNRVAEGTRLLVELSFAYCFDDRAVCRPADLVWVVSVEAGEADVVELKGRAE